MRLDLPLYYSISEIINLNLLRPSKEGRSSFCYNEECNSGKIYYLCPAMRVFLVIIGSVSLALGVMGIFLPMLPTTPFLLLSAAAWVKASPQLYAWLLNHKVFGEYIRNFREHRAIPLRVKITSVSLVWLTIGYCILRVVNEWWWAQLLMALLAAAVSWHILSFKTLKKD